MMVARTIRQRVLPVGASRLPPDLHPVIQRVLLARGVTGPEALQLDMADMLSPQALSGVDAAASLLAEVASAERKLEWKKVGIIPFTNP